MELGRRAGRRPRPPSNSLYIRQMKMFITPLILPIKRVLFIILSIAVASLHAQPDSLWSYTYGGISRDRGYSVIETTDGGLAVAGVYMHSSSHYSRDAYLVKTDANGEVEWERTYDAGGEEEREENSREVIQTSDGGYLLACQTYSNDDTSPDCWAVKTDSAGEIEWANSYGGDDYEDSRSVIETGDGCYLLVGYTTSFGAGAHDFYLVKIDSDGEEIWSRTYGGDLMDYGMDILSTNDGCYMICGNTRSFGNGSKDYYMVKIDGDGEIVWSSALGTELWESCYGVVQTHDGGYALIGFQEEGEDRDVFLVITDDEGEELWTQNYEDRYGVWGKDIVQTADGDFVIASSSTVREHGHGYDFSLFRVEAENGEIVWSTVYGDRRSEFSFSLVQTTDGGYAMTGYTSNSSEEGQNLTCVWLVKTGTDILRWLSMPDTSFAQDSTLIYEMEYFHDYISPAVYIDSALVFSVRNGRHIDGNIEDGQLIITSDEDWFGLDSLRLIMFEEDDEDNGDTTYLRITILEDNDITNLPEYDTPRKFSLIEAYPNPFNSTTSIAYSLTVPERITVKIFDLSGREVATLVDGRLEAGNHHVHWNGLNTPSGVYVCRLEAGGFMKSVKLVLLR